jgi:GNAT superfamily N-acetyltransferase
MSSWQSRFCQRPAGPRSSIADGSRTVKLTATISLLAPGDDRRFASVARIYAAAIEPSEQKPPELLRRHVGDDRYSFLVAEDGGEVVGFAVVFVPSSRDFWLLEYLAVDARRRSAGLGAILFDAAVARARDIAPGTFGLLEVDAADAVVGAGNDIPRRLQFYARNGCRKIEGLRYLLPLTSHGTPPPCGCSCTGAPISHPSRARHCMTGSSRFIARSTISRAMILAPRA